MLPTLSTLAAIRTVYERAGLHERDVDPSPVKQLERWLHDAIQADGPFLAHSTRHLIEARRP